VATLANIDSFIECLPKKYDTLVGDRGMPLPIGIAIQLCIARVMMKNPKVVLIEDSILTGVTISQMFFFFQPL
jgi:ATP-binding cassette subfamily B protein